MEPAQKINYCSVVRAQHKNKQWLKERERITWLLPLAAKPEEFEKEIKENEIIPSLKCQYCAHLAKLKSWHFFLPLSLLF